MREKARQNLRPLLKRYLEAEDIETSAFTTQCPNCGKRALLNADNTWRCFNCVQFQNLEAQLLTDVLCRFEFAQFGIQAHVVIQYVTLGLASETMPGVVRIEHRAISTAGALREAGPGFNVLRLQVLPQ